MFGIGKKRIQQSPVVSENTPGTSPTASGIEMKTDVPMGKKLIFYALTFGFILWGIFYLLELARVLIFFYTVFNISHSALDTTVFLFDRAIFLALSPIVFLTMAVVHAIIAIKFRKIIKITATPGIVFLACSTILLVILSVILVSQMKDTTSFIKNFTEAGETQNAIRSESLSD
jgi:hypothetical protein